MAWYHPIKNSYGAAKSFLNPNQIGYLILFVTNRCNFNCDFCFYYAEIEKGRKPEELTLDEIDKIAAKMGPLLQLSLTGGEPFIRKDLDDITRCFLDRGGVSSLSIPSNASLTDRMVKYMESILPEYPHTRFRLCFSIDGIEEEHDKNRSKPGSFKKIEESYKAIAPLRKHYSNLVLDANTVYTQNTEDRILPIMKELHKRFAFDNLSITYARGVIKDPSLRQTSKDRYIEVNSYLENLKRTKEKKLTYPFVRAARDVARDSLIKTVFDEEFVSPCVAGKKLMVISETGELLPCEILGKSLGNLREVDFDPYQLMARPEAKKLVKWIADSKCKCSFECALAANVVWNKGFAPKVAKSVVKNIGRSDRAPEMPKEV